MIDDDDDNNSDYNNDDYDYNDNDYDDWKSTYKIVLFAVVSAAATFLARPDTMTLLCTTGLIILKNEGNKNLIKQRWHALKDLHQPYHWNLQMQEKT